MFAYPRLEPAAFAQPKDSRPRDAKVRIYAVGFLGVSRSDAATRATEVRWSVRSALALLAVCCALLGVLPTYVIPILDRVAPSMTHAVAVPALVPFFIAAQQQSERVSSQFLDEFHELGAQVGSGLLPGRGLVVLHRGQKKQSSRLRNVPFIYGRCTGDPPGTDIHRV